MAANTKVLPRMDMSISGTLRTQLVMITVSRVDWPVGSLLRLLSVLFIIDVNYPHIANRNVRGFLSKA